MGSFISLNLDSGSSDMDEDLCLKAPFIPVDEDLPLLISATDLMWSSHDEKLNIAQKDFTDSWYVPLLMQTALNFNSNFYLLGAMI